MRVLMVNVVCGIRSTGRICIDLARELTSQGHIVKIAYGREEVPVQYQNYAVRIGNDFDVKMHALESRLLDSCGFGSRRATDIFLKWANDYNPDLLWIHNLHGYYINVEKLFMWIRNRPQMQVRWTLHDCWAFTGHCYHFSYIGCQKWKKQCDNCPQRKMYPESKLIDRSFTNYNKKKALFCGLSDLVLQVPSKWLKERVEQSFLKEYSIDIVPNTIDKSVFYHRETELKKELGIADKRVILGAASRWYRKGFEDFCELARIIDDRFVIVLVGVDKEQIRATPQNIIGIKRTNSADQMAEFYSIADICVSLSKEETFGMTLLEAVNCGASIIAYKDTACEEIVVENGGIAAEQTPYDVWNAIQTTMDRLISRSL